MSGVSVLGILDILFPLCVLDILEVLVDLYLDFPRQQNQLEIIKVLLINTLAAPRPQ